MASAHTKLTDKLGVCVSANFGIALDVLLGSRVIDLLGLARVSMAAASIVGLAIVATVFALRTEPGQMPRAA